VRRASSLTFLAAIAIVACGGDVPTDEGVGTESGQVLSQAGTVQICHLTDGPLYGRVRVVNENAMSEHWSHGDCMADGALPGDACGCPIRIEAEIDGRSRLILSGETAQWHHLDYAAPGRLDSETNDCPNDPPPLPTIINGDEWYPVWPDVPDAENRNCDCTSDVYEGLGRRLPQTEMTPVLNTIQYRWRPAIVQYPNASNGYTTIIEFDDNGFTCAADYVVELNFR